MKKFVIIFVMFAVLQGNAQIFLKSSTLVEASVMTDKISFGQFDQTIAWKGYNREGREKTVYVLHSLYARASFVGVRLYGIDVDLMSERFDRNGANQFRYWNKLRMGIVLALETDPANSFSLKSAVDGEWYFLYTHLPRTARGDGRNKYRQGSVQAFFLITPNMRMDSYFKVKPIGSTWMKFYYRQEYQVQQLGFCVEVETNPKGYGDSKQAKDLYRGLTVFGGPELNLKNSQISFCFGVRWDMRNH